MKVIIVNIYFMNKDQVKVWEDIDAKHAKKNLNKDEIFW